MVPALVHGSGIAGALMATSWFPAVIWVLPFLLASAVADVVRALRTNARPLKLRFTPGGIAVEEGQGVTELDIKEQWLGPGLIVLKVRDHRATHRWWLYRGELSSRDEAHVRRALRARQRTHHSWVA
jgi:hypothetical protein